MYKLLNGDRVADMLLNHDPFHGEKRPQFVKIDLDHYHFTDYRKEKVTFGLKTPLTKIPFLIDLLPTDLQRYFKNSKVKERLTPIKWWVRSDSPKTEEISLSGH
jgi:hypothetical protein